MNYIKKLRALLAKGFATAQEKAEIKSELETQSDDVKEIAADDVEAVEALPETDPSDGAVDQEVEKAIKAIFNKEMKELDGKGGSLKKEIIEETQKIIDQHKSKMEKGVGAYSDEAKKDTKRKVLNKYLREGMKALMGGSDTKEFESIRKEMTTDSSASPYTGYLTDELLSAEIRHLTTEYGVAAREFNTVTLMQSSYKANNLATDVSVFWVDEAGSISSTQAVLGNATLELKKLATIVTLTRELLQEQEIDFVSFIGGRVAEGFAKAEDEAFFVGDGSSTYGGFVGLLNHASVNEVTMATADNSFTDVSVEYLREMQDTTPSGALANAKYYMNRTILTQVRNLREDAVSAGDGAGAFIYKSPIASEPANIDGYPIVLVEAMPGIGDTDTETAFILFGDVKKATIRGVRGGIQVDRFNAGSIRNVADNADINLITTDREAVRWIEQVGYIAILPTAVTMLTTGDTPMV